MKKAVGSIVSHSTGTRKRAPISEHALPAAPPGKINYSTTHMTYHIFDLHPGRPCHNTVTDGLALFAHWHMCHSRIPPNNSNDWMMVLHFGRTQSCTSRTPSRAACEPHNVVVLILAQPLASVSERLSAVARSPALTQEIPVALGHTSTDASSRFAAWHGREGLRAQLETRQIRPQTCSLATACAVMLGRFVSSSLLYAAAIRAVSGIPPCDLFKSAVDLRLSHPLAGGGEF